MEYCQAIAKNLNETTADVHEWLVKTLCNVKSCTDVMGISTLLSFKSDIALKFFSPYDNYITDLFCNKIFK